jgi:uncharacterized protein with NRDE domain
MCLVAFSWKNHPEYPLILSANRDEVFDRHTQSLHQWNSGIIAGKDLRGGGTWMGFHPNGKWSLLTNYRDFSRQLSEKSSRGKLVQDYLEGDLEPEAYLKRMYSKKESFEGFNLLVSDGEKLFYLSNYETEIREIEPGIHGLSNGVINAHWPKITLAKDQLKSLISPEIQPENLLHILKSTETHPLEVLPKTGIPAAMEIGLSSQLIRLPPNYGTVSASAVLVNREGKTQIIERTFNWDQSNFKDKSMNFTAHKN